MNRSLRFVLGVGIAGVIGGLPASPGLCAETGYALNVTAGGPGDASRDDTRTAAEADEGRAKTATPWNEYDGRYFTARGGGGFLVDTANYRQDADSQQQLDLRPDQVLRDFRLLLKGRFKFAPRLTYSIGYMYDAPNKVWRFRQTGLMVDVPEFAGDFFIGRTKEGFSTSKIMVGYHGWTNERAAANDAFLPILADGIKWTGRGFGGRLVYNVGGFTSKLAKYPQPYVKNDKQFVARMVWLPLAQAGKKSVLHLAVEARYGTALGGTLQYRSKPESYPAQSYAVDSGKFAAVDSTMAGAELYFRPGAFTVGSEYFWNQVNSQSTGDPLFHGGEILVAYVLTGETRPYNDRGAYFAAISPARPVFSGGPGAWEPVLRYSYVDIDAGTIQGGKFWRLTPMVNWHLSDNARLEFAYGYSVLDRFGIQGSTQYLQSRLQLSL